MAKILVTGATGCLGSELVRQLADQGHDVLAQGRDRALGAKLAGKNISFLAHDLTMPLNPQLLADVEIVHHCAALSSAWGKAEVFQAINVTATRQLLQVARQAGVSRFVFASSPSIYANGSHRENVAENASLPEQFSSHYARTKYEAEKLVLAADDHAGMRTIALRPRAIYGQGDRSLMPRLLAAIARGKVPMIDGGNALIDITHVSDAARAMILAGEARAIGGEVFNITSGKAFSFTQLLDHICALKQQNPRRINLSYSTAMMIARGLELTHRLIMPNREPVLTCQAVASLGRSLTLDIDKAKTQLNYLPQVPIEQGIKDYA